MEEGEPSPYDRKDRGGGSLFVDREGGQGKAEHGTMSRTGKRHRAATPENGREEGEQMPWYWILIILSAIVGPFEAMHALNKARRNREERERRSASAAGEPEKKTGREKECP